MKALLSQPGRHVDHRTSAILSEAQTRVRQALRSTTLRRGPLPAHLSEEDLVQEVFLVWFGSDGCEDDCDLCVIARRVVDRAVKKRRREAIADMSLFVCERTPKQSFSDLEIDFRQFCNSLGPTDRCILDSQFVGSENASEAANRMSMCRATYYSRLKIVRRKFAEELGRDSK